MILRYNKIRKQDIANGPGLRCSVFFQGCAHHCPNCFNPETWNPEGGKPFTQKEVDLIIDIMKNQHIKGLNLLGGDPLFGPCNDIGCCEQMYNFLKQIKDIYPDKTIWVWTGYIFENFLNSYKEIQKQEFNIPIDTIVFSLAQTRSFMEYIDVLIDGPFIESEKDFKLKYMGSRNQRVIDVQKSLYKDKVILYEYEE